MRIVSVFSYAAIIVFSAGVAHADWISIGAPGNGDHSSGYGGVAHTFDIMETEVSANEFSTAWAADNNISDGDEGSLGGARPAVSTSWFEAAKYANFMTSGNAYTGVYQFGNAEERTGGNDETAAFTGIDRAGALSTYGTIYVVPTEDEWVKAAYYNLDESTAGENDVYYSYAHGLNTVPSEALAGDNTGWNYRSSESVTPWVVGGSHIEQNGTYDMMGNVFEIFTIDGTDWGRRGGYYNAGSSYLNLSSTSHLSGSNVENSAVGFRLARITTVPEPSAGLMLLAAALGIGFLRKAK